MKYLQDWVRSHLIVYSSGLRGDLETLVRELIGCGWRNRTELNDPLKEVVVNLTVGVNLIFRYDPDKDNRRIYVYLSKEGKETYLQPLNLCDPISFKVRDYRRAA